MKKNSGLPQTILVLQQGLSLPVLAFTVAAALKYFRYLPVSMFEADQEYLALAGKSILNGKLTLIGAQTSTGGMFIGPLYNYLVAAVLGIFRSNPLVINGLSFFWMTLTIPALYLVGRKLISPIAGFLAALTALLSVNFVNHAAVPPLLFPLPLIALATISTRASRLRKKTKALILGGLTGLALHLHFSGIFLIPLLLTSGWWGLLSLGALLSPLFLFELRHNLTMTRNAVGFLLSNTGGGTTLPYRLNAYLVGLGDLFIPSSFRLDGILFAVLLIAWGLSQKKLRPITVTTILPLVFFLLYSAHLLPYYTIIAWSGLFLITGSLIETVWQKHRLGKALIITLALWFGFTNFTIWKNWSCGRSIDQKLAALYFIKEQAGNKPIYLSRTIEKTANFGFDYLISYLGLESTGNINDPNYTLIVPADWQGIEPDLQFGGIGVNLPKQEQH